MNSQDFLDKADYRRWWVLEMMWTSRKLLNSFKSRVENLSSLMKGPKYEVLRLPTKGETEGKKWIGRKKDLLIDSIQMNLLFSC